MFCRRERGAPEDPTLECTDGSEVCHREPDDPVLEHAEGSEVYITVMTVILKSPGVASASDKIADMFCRSRFGGAAVDMGLERELVVDQVTGWMIDNVGQQRLHAAEQRVSATGEQPSVARRVEAAEEGPDAQIQALAASSAREASVASDPDMVDKEQMGGEKSVSLIGSPMCQTVCDLIVVMWNANAVSEVKNENLVERCVRRPEGLRMYGCRGMQESCSCTRTRWSHGLNFAKDM